MLFTCPDCYAEFDFASNFKQELAGKGYNHEFGQTEYWFAGVVTCPECGAVTEYSDSSL